MSDPYPDRTEGDDTDHLVETPETLRDSDPEALPVDRDEDAGRHRLAAERYGTTNEEEEAGESLDQRLDQEEPDTGADHDPVVDVVADDPATFAGDDPAEAEQTDDTVLADAYGRGDDPEDEAGRLVAPDEGAHDDEEADAVARDVGRDGGGEGAEEAAVHVVDEG